MAAFRQPIATQERKGVSKTRLEYPLLSKCNHNETVARQAGFTLSPVGKRAFSGESPGFPRMIGAFKQVIAGSDLTAGSECGLAEARRTLFEFETIGKFNLVSMSETTGFNSFLASPANGRLPGAPLLASKDRLAVENPDKPGPGCQVTGRDRESPQVLERTPNGFSAFKPEADACSEAGFQAMPDNDAQEPAGLPFENTVKSGWKSYPQPIINDLDFRVVPQVAADFASTFPAQRFSACFRDGGNDFQDQVGVITIGQGGKEKKEQVYLAGVEKATLLNDKSGEVAGGSIQILHEPELFEKLGAVETAVAPKVDELPVILVESRDPDTQGQMLAKQVVSPAPGVLPPGEPEQSVFFNGAGSTAGEALSEQAELTKKGPAGELSCLPERGPAKGESETLSVQQTAVPGKSEGKMFSNASWNHYQQQIVLKGDDSSGSKGEIHENKATMPESKAVIPESKAVVNESKATVPESETTIIESKAVAPEGKANFPPGQVGRPEQRAGPLQSGWQTQQGSVNAGDPKPAFTGENLVEQVTFMAVRSFEQGSQKTERVRLNLQSEQFGSAEVRLTLAEGVVRAGFYTDNDQAKNVIGSSLNRLREALQGYNLKLGEVAVFVEQQGFRNREQLISINGSGPAAGEAAPGQTALTKKGPAEDLSRLPERGPAKGGPETLNVPQTALPGKSESKKFSNVSRNQRQIVLKGDDNSGSKVVIYENKAAIPESKAIVFESKAAAPESETIIIESKAAAPEGKANFPPGQVGHPEQTAGSLQSGWRPQQGSVNAGITNPAFTGEKLVEQVTFMAVRAFMQDNQKTVRVRLQLQPEQLGKVEVRLTMLEGVVRASFFTDNEQARNAIGSSLEQLKEALQGYHLQLGESAVFVDQQGWGGREQPFLSTGNNRSLAESGIYEEQSGGIEETEKNRDGKHYLINYLV